MKSMSIRWKITLWFAAALVVIVGLAYFIVLFACSNVIQKTIRDALIETVEHNVDEVEYYDNLADLAEVSDADHFIEYADGYLEIDDDYLNEVNEVYTSLYREDRTFLYGENPIASEAASMDFIDRQLQNLRVGKTRYYVFDRKLEADGLEGLWLRGVVSEKQGETQMQRILRVSLILLPALVLLTIAGGSLIAGRALRPINRIRETASQISEGGDLKKRIDIGEGTDELHQLADTFNGMFGRLENAFETERQFTADASHELRTPMAVIMAQCEYALEQPRDPEEYRSALGVIRRQGKRMTGLINDLLVFMRLELRQDYYEKQELDFSALAEAVCSDLAAIREKNITLQTKLVPGIRLRGNPELLARLLTNLTSNAYRSGKENGSVCVALHQQEDTVLLRVSDDGIGIAKEEQSKIFHRFYQADSSRAEQGSGLGLSMVQKIAEFHGGTVTVESEPGRGSTFTFSCKKINSL